MLDALASAEQLAVRAASLKMPALSITDHGTLRGIPRFHRECRKVGVKPILGCEFYVVPDRKVRDKDGEWKSRRHLTVLAQNASGWQNLVRLSNLSNREGFYYDPRIDENLLFEHSAGLIVLSGCQSGDFSKQALNSPEAAADVAHKYREVFGENYFMEIVCIEPNDERAYAVHAAQSISRIWNIPAVVTGDVHFLTEEDSEFHYYVTKIGHGKVRKGYRIPELWLKDGSAIFDTFRRLWSGVGLSVPFIRESITRSVEIAASIESYDIDPGCKLSEIPFRSAEMIA
jgi:DNA polymerase-3 subunit alpha